MEECGVKLILKCHRDQRRLHFEIVESYKIRDFAERHAERESGKEDHDHLFDDLRMVLSE